MRQRYDGSFLSPAEALALDRISLFSVMLVIAFLLGKTSNLIVVSQVPVLRTDLR